MAADDTTDAPDRTEGPAVADLGYEEARDELASIVATLENGSASLEESMRLWERGEALATHCRTWLDDASARVAALRGEASDED